MRCQHVDDDIQCRLTRRVLVATLLYLPGYPTPPIVDPGRDGPQPGPRRVCKSVESEERGRLTRVTTEAAKGIRVPDR